MAEGGSEHPPGWVHAVKWINFLGHQRPIILQNENGPCPLIAIVNCLLLLGKFTLDKGYRFVDNSWIIQQVHDHIVRTNQSADTKPEFRANMEYLIRDVRKVLPQLQRGMDVNVRFGDCESFEFTPELSVYDLTGLRLLHGWVVDKSDALHDSLSSLTFNGAMDKVIIATAEKSAAEAKDKEGELPVPLSPTKREENVIFSPQSMAVLSKSDAISATDDEIHTAHTSNRLSLNRFPALAEEGGATAEEASLPGVEGTHALIATSPLIHADDKITTTTTTATATANAAGEAFPMVSTEESKPAVDEASGGAGTVLVREAKESDNYPEHIMNSDNNNNNSDNFMHAMALDAWLKDNASQLTVTGLSQIFSRMVDREVAVFFRNNHFSTIFKHKQRLFLLVTDEGYQDVPEIVWELLDDVAGDTLLVDADFRMPEVVASQAYAVPEAHEPPKASQPSPTGSGIELPPDFHSLPPEEQRLLAQVLAASKGELSPSALEEKAPYTANVSSPSDAQSRPMPPPIVATPVGKGSVNKQPTRNPNDRYGHQAEALRKAAAAREARKQPPPDPVMDEDSRLAYALQQRELAYAREEELGAEDTRRNKGCVIC